MDGIGNAGGLGPQGLDRLRETARPAPGQGAGEADRSAAARHEPMPTPASPGIAAVGDPGLDDALAMPEGVEPELWSLLTTEERAHFARFAAMGGVTYGPKAAGPKRPFVRGQRLDVRI